MRKVDLRTLIVLFVGSMVFFTSCEKDNGTEGFINLTDQYEILLHQQLSLSGSTPELIIKTLEEEECNNAFISHQATKYSSVFNLVLNEVLVEGACIEEASIIEERVNLGNLDPSFNIIISLEDLVNNHGVIERNEDKFSLELKSNHGLKISKSSIYRIKEGMLWGYFSNENGAQVMEYINMIKTNQEPNHGDYGLFYVDNNQEVHSESLSNADEYSKFLIFTEENWDEITETMGEFQTNHPTLEIGIFNYRGQSMIL